MNSKKIFINESSNIPEMVKLREKYSLVKVIKGKKRQFDKIIALRNWVQQCWENHGYDQIPESNNALKILEAAAQGKFFQCHHYAAVFIQCAVALGFKARRLGIGIHPSIERPGNSGHIVPEIWSDDFQKWVIMDPDMNAHYENKDGIPANALEIHNAWVTQQLDKIKYIQGKPVPKMISKFTPEKKASQFVFGAYNVIDYYFKIQVQMRNNWFSSDQSPNPSAIAWIDKYHPDYNEKVGKTIGNVLWTDKPEILYWEET